MWIGSNSYDARETKGNHTCLYLGCVKHSVREREPCKQARCCGVQTPLNVVAGCSQPPGNCERYGGAHERRSREYEVAGHHTDRVVLGFQRSRCRVTQPTQTGASETRAKKGSLQGWLRFVLRSAKSNPRPNKTAGSTVLVTHHTILIFLFLPRGQENAAGVRVS